jgi:hypothetical protein
MCASRRATIMAYKMRTMPTVESGGVPINYEVIGQGRPIVLVHGFSSSFDGQWRLSGWVDFLVGEGHQVIGRLASGGNAQHLRSKASMLEQQSDA